MAPARRPRAAGPRGGSDACRELDLRASSARRRCAGAGALRERGAARDACRDRAARRPALRPGAACLPARSARSRCPSTCACRRPSARRWLVAASLLVQEPLEHAASPRGDRGRSHDLDAVAVVIHTSGTSSAPAAGAADLREPAVERARLGGRARARSRRALAVRAAPVARRRPFDPGPLRHLRHHRASCTSASRRSRVLRALRGGRRHAREPCGDDPRAAARRGPCSTLRRCAARSPAAARCLRRAHRARAAPPACRCRSPTASPRRARRSTTTPVAEVAADGRPSAGPPLFCTRVRARAGRRDPRARAHGRARRRRRRRLAAHRRPRCAGRRRAPARHRAQGRHDRQRRRERRARRGRGGARGASRRCSRRQCSGEPIPNGARR